MVGRSVLLGGLCFLAVACVGRAGSKAANSEPEGVGVAPAKPSRRANHSDGGARTPSRSQKGANGPSGPTYPPSPTLIKEYASRKAVPTRVDGGCVYSGSFEPSVVTYAEALGGQPYLVLHHGRGVHLFESESAEVPFATLQSGNIETVPRSKATRRFEVQLSFPLNGRYWVSSDAPLWSLRKRMDVVKGHFWLEQGAGVALAKEGEDAARLLRPDLDPRFELKLPCSALQLGQFLHTSKPGGTWVPLKAEPIPLFAAPGGSSITRLTGAPGAHEQQRRDSWVQLIGGDDFKWKGWLEARYLAAPVQAPPPGTTPDQTAGSKRAKAIESASKAGGFAAEGGWRRGHTRSPLARRPSVR